MKLRNYRFVTGMLILSQGTKTEKLRLAFGMFDTDKDGAISRDEMYRINNFKNNFKTRR